jgi:Tfp pilus assembly protein PilN
MVDRFLINLNRGEGQEEKAARWRKRQESITLYAFGLVFIVLIVFNYNNHKALRELIQTKERKIVRINRELEELKRQGQNVSKVDVLALAKLEQTRFLWTKKFKALAEILPDNTAVTGMEFANDAFVIKFVARIKPEVKDFEKISEIMELLKGTEDFFKDFMDIKFSESQRITVEGQDILSFAVQCNLRKTVTATKKKAASSGKRLL